MMNGHERRQKDCLVIRCASIETPYNIPVVIPVQATCKSRLTKNRRLESQSKLSEVRHSRAGGLPKTRNMFLFYTKQGGLYESRHSRAGGTAGRRVPADAGIQCANESDK